MIDTHTHLNLSPLEEMASEVVNRAIESGVSAMVCVGTDVTTSSLAVHHAKTFESVFASVGIHPEEANKLPGEALDSWRESILHFAEHPKVVAIGECGLDYSHVHSLPQSQATSQKNAQKRLMGMHIQIAKEVNKPLIIHARNAARVTDTPSSSLNAYQDVLDTLRHFSTSDGVIPPFVLHCVSGPLSYIMEALQMGAYISFAGNVTYPSAHAIRDILHITPLDRLLTETDAPFLSPQSQRGTPNESSKMAETVEFIATELGMSTQEVDTHTSTNARRFFTLPSPV
jgi:TatD DNase family protein